VLLPDVTWLREGDGEQRLHVRSPRIARRTEMTEPPPSYRMADLVVPTGERLFRQVGRSNGLVKINGRRCDLDGVATLVRRLVPGTQVCCVPVPDPLRGEHYDLYYTTGPEPAELRARLAELRGDVPAPRSVVRVAAIGAR
jgi:hypothetical protein